MKYENSMVKIADDIVKKCKDNSFQSVRFSTDYGYATSLNLRVYLWEDEIEGQEPVMVVEYKPVEWEMDYDIVHDPVSYTHLTLPTT